jgi:hypothetical protein
MDYLRDWSTASIAKQVARSRARARHAVIIVSRGAEKDTRQSTTPICVLSNWISSNVGMHQHLDRLRGFLVRRSNEGIADLVERVVMCDQRFGCHTARRE